MTNTKRQFRNVAPSLWQASDRADIVIGLNSTSTMFTVESAHDVRDFWIDGRAQDTFDAAVAYARTL